MGNCYKLCSRRIYLRVADNELRKVVVRTMAYPSLYGWLGEYEEHDREASGGRWRAGFWRSICIHDARRVTGGWSISSICEDVVCEAREAF